MGFKKGWAAFKRSKSPRKVKRKTATARVAKVRRRSTMAKRKKTSTRRRGMSRNVKIALGGAGYGLAREPLNQLAKRIPMVGAVADEVVLMGLSFLIANYGKGIVKNIGQAGLAIESHNLVRQMSGGSFQSLFGNPTQVAAPQAVRIGFR